MCVDARLVLLFDAMGCGFNYVYGMLFLLLLCVFREFWLQLGQSIYGDANNDRLGTNVAINNDGDIIAVGTPLIGVPDDGEVSVYQLIGCDVVILGKLLVLVDTNVVPLHCLWI